MQKLKTLKLWQAATLAAVCLALALVIVLRELGVGRDYTPPPIATAGTVGGNGGLTLPSGPNKQVIQGAQAPPIVNDGPPLAASGMTLPSAPPGAAAPLPGAMPPGVPGR